MVRPFNFARFSPSLKPTTIVVWMVAISSIAPIIRRVVPIETVVPVVLIPVAIIEAPFIRRNVGINCYGIHTPIILIQIPKNTLARFASTVPSEKNGASTMPLTIMLVSSASSTTSTRSVVLILKGIWTLLIMGTIMLEARVN